MTSLASLSSQLESDVPSLNGTPTAAQYGQAVRDAVADLGRRMPRVALTTLAVVSGTASYALPADFVRLVALDRIASTGSAMSLSSYGGGPAFFAFSFTTLSYVADVLRMYRGMYGGNDPADGFGSRMTFELEDDSHTARVAGAFEITLPTAAAASFKGRIRLLTIDSGGAREILRGEGSGSAAALGFLGASATAREAVAADATDLASAIALVNDLKAKLITKGLVA